MPWASGECNTLHVLCIDPFTGNSPLSLYRYGAVLITSCELAAGDVVTVSLNVILFHITQMPLPLPRSSLLSCLAASLLVMHYQSCRHSVQPLAQVLRCLKSLTEYDIG